MICLSDRRLPLSLSQQRRVPARVLPTFSFFTHLPALLVNKSHSFCGKLTDLDDVRMRVRGNFVRQNCRAFPLGGTIRNCQIGGPRVSPTFQSSRYTPMHGGLSAGRRLLVCHNESRIQPIEEVTCVLGHRRWADLIKQLEAPSANWPLAIRSIQF